MFLQKREEKGKTFIIKLLTYFIRKPLVETRASYSSIQKSSSVFSVEKISKLFLYVHVVVPYKIDPFQSADVACHSEKNKKIVKVKPKQLYQLSFKT